MEMHLRWEGKTYGHELSVTICPGCCQRQTCRSDRMRDVTDRRDSEYRNQHLGAHLFGFERLKTSKTLHFLIRAEG
jgi:hypothetical protein